MAIDGHNKPSLHAGAAVFMGARLSFLAACGISTPLRTTADGIKRRTRHVLVRDGLGGLTRYDGFASSWHAGRDI